MSKRNLLLRSASYCLWVGVLFAIPVAGTSVLADPATPVNPLQKRFLTGKALDICDFGAFFVGGVPKVPDFGEPRQIIIGQMYVQFMIPTKRRQWPLIMVHGGGLTGATLDATPDGREGWFPRAVNNNYATFIGDQPGRGRSGFDASVINEARVTNDAASLPVIGEPACDTHWRTWFGHIIPAGTNIVTGTMIRHGDPGDPDPAETDPPSQAHGVYPPLYPIPPVDSSIDANIEARIGAIGVAPNPANNTYLAMNACKAHVASMEVTLPGSECPSCNPTTLAASNTWSPRAWAELVERLGGAVISGHSQSVPQALHTMRVLKERGSLHLLKGLLLPEGSTILEEVGLTPSDFDTVPMLIVNGDYRPDREAVRRNYSTVAAINASPTRSVGPAQVIDLDSPEFNGKFNGTTHMMMFGTNSNEVFDLILDWAEENIPNPIVQTSCASGPPDVPPGLSKKPGGLPPGQAKKN